MEQIIFKNRSNKWKPKVGQAAITVVNENNLNNEEAQTIISESAQILASCGSPELEKNDQTGLAIGYVQSGKTLSFTTLIALAAENGFNLIIVIAGTTKPLLDQTHKRLLNDLEVNNSKYISWKSYKNPKRVNLKQIEADLKPSILNRNPVLLITVMKNWSHLRALNSLLNSLKSNVDLKALIIDDEADQASLNTKANVKNEDETSTTYAEIRDLKNNLKKHTFIQYTATPQAPLFISILDILSPDFVSILTPGKAYTGGRTFFQRNKNSKYPYIYNIPEDEVYSKNNKFNTIPKSLEEAVMFFYITVVIGALEGGNSRTGNRTMMVHPSQLTQIHRVYKRWVELLKIRILVELSLKESDPDRKTLISRFRKEYEKITNYESLIDFEIISDHLHEIVEGTPIILQNSQSEDELDFKRTYSAILVGGQILDRGFTVEGLNVTYMPRSIGGGNADTIQQRCRFFGYKKKYIQLCRIYLPRRSKRAYIDYVMHEEDVRLKLKDLTNQGLSLKEYKREFLLSPDLNITRRNVLSDDIRRYVLKGWRSLSHIDPNSRENNEIFSEFTQLVNWSKSRFSGSTEVQTHKEYLINAIDFIEDFLLSLKFSDPSNALLFNNFLSILSYLIKNNENEKVLIVLMSSGAVRARRTGENNKVSLQQGSNEKTKYKGDRAAKHPNNITVQLHHVGIKDSKRKYWTMAIHFPGDRAQSIISLDN